jgi:hypothetical protein
MWKIRFQTKLMKQEFSDKMMALKAAEGLDDSDEEL